MISNWPNPRHLIYSSTLLVTAGRWIQNVAIAAYAYDITSSAAIVGGVIFAQLSPLLLFGPLFGALTDRYSRAGALLISVFVQCCTALCVALFAIGGEVSLLWYAALLFLGGAAQTLFLSSSSALLANVVPSAGLRRATEFNSIAMSVARMLSPGIGAALYSCFGGFIPLLTVSLLFGSVAFFTWVNRQSFYARGQGRRGSAFFEGLKIIRATPRLRGALTVIAAYSFGSLPFLNQMPAVADQLFSISVKDSAYSILLFSLGLGSLLGGWAMVTIFSKNSLTRLTRYHFWVFGALLLILPFVHSSCLIFVIFGGLGFTYFGVVTSLQTFLQINTPDLIRGRVMALWFMGYGGFLPVGSFVAGFVIDAWSVTMVFVVGSSITIPLGWFVNRRAMATGCSDSARGN